MFCRNDFLFCYAFKAKYKTILDVLTVINRTQFVLSMQIREGQCSNPKGFLQEHTHTPELELQQGREEFMWEAPAQLLWAGPIQLQLGKAFPQGHAGYRLSPAVLQQ